MKDLGTLSPHFGDGSPEPTLQAILSAYALAHGAPDPTAAHAYAARYLAVLIDDVAQNEPWRQFERFVVENWGEANAPDHVQAEFGPATTPREQYLLNALAELNNDYVMATGLGGENGEVLEVLKKGARSGRDLDVAHLEEELGDALHYWVRVAKRYGLDPLTIMDKNKRKLEARWAARRAADAAEASDS